MSHTRENTLPDKEVVKQVLQGDRNAFAQVIQQTESLVWNIIRHMIPNAEDRKDLVQEVYLKSYAKLGGFRFQAKLSTWIAQITYNACLNWLAKKKLLLAGEGFGPAGSEADGLENFYHRHRGREDFEADQPVLQKERVMLLRAALGRLPPLYQTLISLYHVQDCSYQEMAVITGLPEGTVKSYLFRARKMLRENLTATYKKDEL